MKYYKLIKSGGGYDSGIAPLIVNKIYSGNFKGTNLCTVEKYAFGSEYWKEVPAGEYFVQEGIMPEYFAIKIVADNPLWKKYIDWLNMTYNRYVDGTSIMYPYYGFGGKNIWSTDLYKSKLTDFKNNPVELTLEQWDQIINKTMEENDKEIIGWKLKEDCEQYKQAALNIVNYSKFYNFAEGYNFTTNSTNERILKKAGVLELWFEPVFDEEFKVGDWITVIGDISGGWLENTKCKTFQITREKTEYQGGKYFGVFGSGYTNAGLYTKFRLATPEEVKAAQIPQITINDYKGEFFDNFVKFGCAEIDKNWFLQFYEIMRTVTYSNKEIESVTIGKGTFTKDQIKEIAEYYLNKK